MKILSLFLLILTPVCLNAGLIPIKGHADILWTWEANNTWSCKADEEELYGLESVYFFLSDKLYSAGSPKNSGSRRTATAAVAFTGVSAGQPIWIIPKASPGEGEAWTGFKNNQANVFGSYVPNDPRVLRIDQAARSYIKVSLDSYSPPLGVNAHFSMWDTSGSTIIPLMSTFDANVVNAYHFVEGVHTHVNWGFSHPGIHKIRLKASAFLGPGATNPTGESTPQTLIFAIGAYAHWQANHFSSAELDNPSISAGDADPDQDGMKNMLEYAFGYDPKSASVVPESAGLGLPTFSMIQENGTFYEVMEYPRRRAGTELSPLLYAAEFSSDFNWLRSGVTTTTSDFLAPLNGLNAVWQKASSRRAVGTISPMSGFGRVSVGFTNN